jgi:hypothetical protein
VSASVYELVCSSAYVDDSITFEFLAVTGALIQEVIYPARRTA